MPVIHTHVSVSTTPEQREALKSAYGKAITAVPGKSEGWLMCPFEDNMPIWRRNWAFRPTARTSATPPPPTGAGTAATSDEVSTVPSRFAHIANLSPHLRGNTPCSPPHGSGRQLPTKLLPSCEVMALRRSLETAEIKVQKGGHLRIYASDRPKMLRSERYDSFITRSSASAWSAKW